MNQEQDMAYSEILQHAQSILNSEQEREEKLQAICELLDEKIEIFDWTGFYMVDPNAERELVLGPFVGEPTDHTRIPFGRGICGQAAETKETFVVQDVSKADNYLSCSIHVNSEIVVPIMKGDEVIGELDIDSHTKNALTDDHRELLEELCKRIAQLY
jgi:GAF domain-containing protein